ncbi:MAG: hypothetical protein K0S75_2989 [Clostridia bacterium]|nr:hypothetical protein [Clostridia bacterium]
MNIDLQIYIHSEKGGAFVPSLLELSRQATFAIDKNILNCIIQ